MTYDAIDEALRAGALAPPEDFVERVMVEVATRPIPRPQQDRMRRQDLFEWLAVAGAVAAGTAQLVGFLFSVWSFTAAV